MKKGLHFSHKQRKFYRAMLMAENLEKRLSWVPQCENGIERIVEFFQEITPFEEYYYGSVFYLFFWKEKKRHAVNLLGKFASNVGKKPDQYQEWNTTKEDKIPSNDSVFIRVDDVIKEQYEDDNITLHTMNVTKCLERKLCPPEERNEKYPGQWEQELEILNEITLLFMKNNYRLLKEPLEKFR